MKRQIQAVTTDRLFHAIDRTLVAPLRARLDRDVDELRTRVAAAEQAVFDLAESLEPRVVALEEALFSGVTATDPRTVERRVDGLSDELRRRTDTLGAETGATAAALADLAERITRLESGAGARSALS